MNHLEDLGRVTGYSYTPVYHIDGKIIYGKKVEVKLG